MSERITVFDIEVLNQDPASVCAIGIVELLDQQVISTYYSLVKPRNLSYDVYRYKVHKIKTKSLLKERPFQDVWKDIHHYFENTIVVSHDIQGDMMNLRAVLKQNHISYPHLYMSCTNVLAHLVYPDLHKYNVKELSQMIGFEFQAHHALDDAKACAQILIEMLKYEHCETLQELHQRFHLDFGEMKENYYRNIISAEIAPQLRELSQREDAFLYHQFVCFTGKLSMPRELLEEKTKHSFSFLYPDNFDQLSRSGRLSPMAARMASMLKIKALLCLDEQGKSVDKYSMSRTEVKVLKAITDKFHELGVNAEKYKIYISHADNIVFAKKSKLLLQTTFHGIEVEINNLPAVLTCHGGLACCALHSTYKI